MCGRCVWQSLQAPLVDGQGHRSAIVFADAADRIDAALKAREARARREGAEEMREKALAALSPQERDPNIPRQWSDGYHAGRESAEEAIRELPTIPDAGEETR